MDNLIYLVPAIIMLSVVGCKKNDRIYDDRFFTPNFLLLKEYLFIDIRRILHLLKYKCVHKTVNIDIYTIDERIKIITYNNIICEVFPITSFNTFTDTTKTQTIYNKFIFKSKVNELEKLTQSFKYKFYSRNYIVNELNKFVALNDIKKDDFCDVSQLNLNCDNKIFKNK